MQTGGEGYTSHYHVEYSEKCWLNFSSLRFSNQMILNTICEEIISLHLNCSPSASSF